MDSIRGNRKVLPNYLLDDYVPSSDSKAASNHGSKSSSSHLPSAEGAHGHIDHATGLGEGSASAGDLSDASVGAFGLLPRRKKKLRQACVYCRRSHLVCEEKRPCQRCVKRGIADRCVDPPQEGQLLQDAGWASGVEKSSSAGSVKDAFISPPPPANPGSSSTHAELTGADSGAKRKRKAKADGPRMSAQYRQANDADSHSDYNPPQGGLELANAAVPYGPTPDHAHPMSTTNGSSQGPSLSSGMPVHSVASYAPLPTSMPMQAEPPVAARAPSQLLQGQPIFQPPSSAELDSLFSTYFFDVADAFNARQNNGQPPGMHSPHPAGHAASLFHQQQIQHPQAPQRPGEPRQQTTGSTLQAAHEHRLEHLVGQGPSQRGSQANHPAPISHQQQQQQHRQPMPISINEVSPADTSTSGGHSTFVNVAAPSTPASGGDGLRTDARQEQVSPKGKDVAGRQKPGDVYAPYPYRKGYASLMRYMTEQNWSEQSIRSVEAALSKIRRLWFSLEDNIQPSSMIQLQAEWAGNVRYFSESVLPFTPIPMVVCRKAGEVYASNQLAQDLCGRSRDQMTGGKLSCYELMTESSASKFFRLYELAVGGSQAEDGSYIPTVGNTAPLYWNAEIVRPNPDGSQTVLPTRGVFEMKIAPCGLPSLLVCCFVPLS